MLNFVLLRIIYLMKKKFKIKRNSIPLLFLGVIVLKKTIVTIVDADRSDSCTEF